MASQPTMTDTGEYDEHTIVRHYYQYFPAGVKRVIESGTSSTDEGLYLERAPNGTIAEYILKSGKPLSLPQRLAWCRETASAVAWIHAHRVLHCDIQPTNLLLDKDLHVKLSDFQGKLLAEECTMVLVDGGSMEPYRFSLPRDNFRTDVKTDLFALGCTVYFILLGHMIFPDIGLKDAEAWERVEERLKRKEWPREEHACKAVVLKCWEEEYESAEEVVRDLEAVEREHGVEAGALVKEGSTAVLEKEAGVDEPVSEWGGKAIDGTQ
ncbi:kinase-like domain-containing protein [Staphylotrichum tortipilum]|uniref:non-specific serine/threonine protein kinase n=1 Tax=Staphylotrichum tortipilum TaxID=2831512 RepID=A0AAN6MPS9_9PEZI|nr:kinase-like domain-containing protein [Staphylotrichum longicolle]